MIDLICWTFCVVVGFVAGYWAANRETESRLAAGRAECDRRLLDQRIAYNSELAEVKRQADYDIRRLYYERNERQKALGEINQIAGAFATAEATAIFTANESSESVQPEPT